MAEINKSNHNVNKTYKYTKKLKKHYKVNGEECGCQLYNAKCFKQNFTNWTSRNNIIDKFIKKAKLKAKNYYQVLEWIKYDRLKNNEYLARFGTYKAIWRKDGYYM